MQHLLPLFRALEAERSGANRAGEAGLPGAEVGIPVLATTATANDSCINITSAAFISNVPPVWQIAVVGDFNVIPNDRDVWSVKAMASDALMQPESRDAYARLLGDGWTDALDTLNPRGGVWTFWDYQAGAWPRDHGFRIDHLLLSPELADRLVAAGVDKEYRGREKASDHAPVWVEVAG